MAIPIHLLSTWTWFGTGVSTIAAKQVTKKIVSEAAKQTIKTAVKTL